MANELDLHLLRHFVAAPEELHFSRPVERIRVTQQALGRDVRKLEDPRHPPALTTSPGQVP